MPLRNCAISNSTDFEISDDEFRQVVSNLKKLYGNYIKISERNEDKIQSNYLLINSVGDFIITENLKDKKIYNIDEELKSKELEEINVNMQLPKLLLNLVYIENNLTYIPKIFMKEIRGSI